MDETDSEWSSEMPRTSANKTRKQLETQARKACKSYFFCDRSIHRTVKGALSSLHEWKPKNNDAVLLPRT